MTPTEDMVRVAAEALKGVPVRDRLAPGGDLDELRLREAARAALTAALAAMWQSIETAERDSVVLVCNPAEGRLPVVAMKVEDTWYQHDLQGTELRPEPTHWMKWPKLPAPTQLSRGDSEKTAESNHSPSTVNPRTE